MSYNPSFAPPSLNAIDSNNTTSMIMSTPSLQNSSVAASNTLNINNNAHAPLPSTLPNMPASLQSISTAFPTAFDPTCANICLDWCHAYITQLLRSANSLRLHRNGKEVTSDDIALAVSTTATEPTRLAPAGSSVNYFAPIPTSLLSTLSTEMNAKPLPLLPTRKGILLPPERFCLLGEDVQYHEKSSERNDSITSPPTSVHNTPRLGFESSPHHDP